MTSSQTARINASADEVWRVVGGFYTIHKWHPVIGSTTVPPDQADTGPVRRIITLPQFGETTVEELVIYDAANRHYRYKWHSGEWGEKVKDYSADIRVFDSDNGKACIVQWESRYIYHEDPVSEFYKLGLAALQKMFP